MDLEYLKDTPPWEWPADAGKFLLGIIRNRRSAESDRLLAVELAGDYTVINDEIANALLSIVADNDEAAPVRGEAAVSMGIALEHGDTIGFDDPDDLLVTEEVFGRIKKTLRDLFKDQTLPKDLRRQILEASVHAPQDWHTEAVRKAFDSGDETWQITAVFCMRYIRGLDGQILQALESDNQDIAYQAVHAAGTWGLAKAWPRISALLTSDKTDKPLLLAAIEAVPGLRPEATAIILADFLEDADEDIAEAAEEALTMVEMLEEFDFEEDENDD